jgi:S-adenosylmethionine-diacylglycerol 3-amino-3-carboxypropyl transferase
MRQSPYLQIKGDNMAVVDWCSKKAFSYIHGSNLIYNQCWEDPRLDHTALNIGKNDHILAITSAGCNVLDYALSSPKKISAVDMNPKQNALLDLKMAGIRALDYETFFEIFGYGRHPDFSLIYYSQLRPHLSTESQHFWDHHQGYFSGPAWRPSFYFRGTSGLVARMINYYVDLTRIRPHVERIFECDTQEEQSAIYFEKLKPEFWNKAARWTSRQEAFMYLLGVPRPQLAQIQKGYQGGVSQFIEDCIETVFSKISLKDNYFWWLYFNGAYSKHRCPEYLKEENFRRLKGGLVDSIEFHTGTINKFLTQNKEKVSKFVLLDHMDWLYTHDTKILSEEWQGFVNRAAPESRIIWRSAGLSVNFVNPIRVEHKGRERKVADLLDYKLDLAYQLHKKDRVHTYGSFYIADLTVC